MILKKVVIVGLGSIGKRHLRVLKKIRPDLEIVVLRSGKGEYCEEERLADAIYTSVEDVLLSGVEAAIISNPANLHLDSILDFVKMGIPVLVEKPLSVSLARLDEVREVIKSKNVPVLVGYVLRYRRDLRHFKDSLGVLNIGRIHTVNIQAASYLPSWRQGVDYRKGVSAQSNLGGGVLLELSHELDYALWCFGDLRVVSAVIRNSGALGIDVEDQAYVVLRSGSGIMVRVELEFNNRTSNRKCVVVADDGQLEIDLLSKVVSSTYMEKLESREFEFEYDEPYENQLLHYLNCVEEGATELIPMEQGVRVLELIEEIRNKAVYMEGSI